MSNYIGRIRAFHTERFTVVADAYYEDEPVDVDDDGETQRAVDRGDYLHFRVHVRVMYKGRTIGEDHLGGCIYESISAFMDHKECGKQNREWEAQGKEGRCGSYFTDMIHEAIREARKTLADVKTVRMRQVA